MRFLVNSYFQDFVSLKHKKDLDQLKTVANNSSGISVVIKREMLSHLKLEANKSTIVCQLSVH